MNGRAEIDIWAIALRQADAAIDAMNSLLSPDERARACRYLHQQDRLRFITGRSWLRSILGSYTGIAAADVAFSYGPYGKPRLLSPPPSVDVRFSVSHTTDMVVLAICPGYEIGVDVETLDQRIGSSDEYNPLLTQVERGRIQATPPGECPHLFLTYWTRKEACLKALGSGFLDDPRDIEVSLGATLSLRNRNRSGGRRHECVVSFADVVLDGTHVCAAAILGQSIAPRAVLRCYVGADGRDEWRAARPGRFEGSATEARQAGFSLSSV